jgi:putative GTP pyrophosphokinase
MALASEILARAHEGLKGPFPELSGEEVVRRFGELDRELALLNTLRGLNASHADGSEKKNTILIFSDLEELETRHFRDATDAMKELFQLELEFPEKDIVLPSNRSLQRTAKSVTPFASAKVAPLSPAADALDVRRQCGR